MMLLISACVSALGFSLSLPNEIFLHGFPLGGFLCLAPYFYALKQAHSRREGAVLGFVFGMVFHVSSSWWLANFKDYALWTLGATSILYGIFYGFWAVLLQYAASPDGNARSGLVSSNGSGSIDGTFSIALVWTMMEWQKSNGYFAFPWGLLPYTVQSVPVLIQIADTGGVYGLSFFLALCNAVLTELPRRKFLTLSPDRMAALLLLVLVLAYGAWRLEKPAPVIREIPLVLVQHNIDQYSNDGEALAMAVDLSRQAAASLRARSREPAIIVWSETLLTMPYKGNRFYRAHPAVPFLEQSSIPVLTGAPLVLIDGPEIANGAILVQNGEIIAAYGKQQLIPFAETIPFGEKKWMRDLMEKFAGFSSGWSAGREAVIMEIPGLRFGTPICFEDAFAGLCRKFVKNGAELLINLTNDSWSLSASAQIQHLAAARFRAIENRRSLVRSTNSGCTAVIDAQGRTIACLPMFTADYLAADVPVQCGSPTVYFLLGDWFPLLCALMFFGQLIWRQQKRTCLDKRNN